MQTWNVHFCDLIRCLQFVQIELLTTWTNDWVVQFLHLLFLGWLYRMTVQKLVVVIRSIETNEVMERWQFDVECDKSAINDNNNRQVY